MLKIYNTFKHKKESFTETRKGEVKMYNCGPTVYSRLTIGNLRTYVFSDILRRSLAYLGYDVYQVMNITDVGHLTMTQEQKERAGDVEITDTDSGLDRMEKAAKAEKMTVWQVAEKYTDLFMQDIRQMNLQIPHKFTKATDHIPEQIEMIEQLISKGYAYVTQTGVYFNTAKYPDYALLTGQNLDEKLTAVRTGVEKDPTKKNPVDFRLWQLDQPDHAMQWESPWGRGFPGWHIECSAMSVKYLGQPIDIHTGGVDHIAVHHPNEIAQTEAATGKKFVNYWMHGGFLRVDGKRMGKSLGNAYTLDDIIAKGYEPLDLRFFYLGAHYRQLLNFTWEALAAAKTRLDNIRSLVANLMLESETTGSIVSEISFKFKAALEDDLNIPKTLALVSEIINSEASNADKLATLLNFDEVWGLGLSGVESMAPQTIKEIEKLIKIREQARAEGNWQKADEIRAELLKDFSVIIEDKDKETNWKVQQR